MVNVKPGTITISDTSQFSKDISALYLNDRFSDVILIVDGTELHAHGVRIKNLMHFEIMLKITILGYFICPK